MLPYFGVVRSLLELVKKFQGLLVELENLNFSFLRFFSGYDNFPRTIQGLCEPCINLKTIQWQTNLNGKAKKLTVLQDYMHNTFNFLNTVLLKTNLHYKFEWQFRVSTKCVFDSCCNCAQVL